MTVRAMAIGGHADGRYVEFPDGARFIYGYANPYVSWALVSDHPTEEVSFTVLRTLYRLEEFRFGSGESSIFFAVADGWTPKQVLQHLLTEHRVVG